VRVLRTESAAVPAKRAAERCRLQVEREFHSRLLAFDTLHDLSHQRWNESVAGTISALDILRRSSAIMDLRSPRLNRRERALRRCH